MKGLLRSTALLLLLWALSLSAPVRAYAQIDMEQVIKIGQNAIYFKDYVLAIQLFNNAVRADSTRAEPYYYRAMAKYQLDDYLGAEEDASRAIGHNPFIYEAYYLRGIARHTLGRDSLAALDYAVVLRNNPDHKGALHNASALYISLKDTLSARKTIAHLRRYFPDYAMGYVLDGGLHLEEKDTLAAEQLFRKALTLDASLTAAYLSLAEIEYNRSQYPAAEELITKAIGQIPRESRLFVNRALMRYKQNNIRGAMTDYTEAVDLDPSSTLAHYNRALLRTQVGELNGALEDLNMVVSQDPNNYFALFNRAILSNRVGDPSLAKSDLDKIIRRYPTFLPAYTERANAFTLLGRELEARQDLYQASKMVYDKGTADRAKALQEVQKELETEFREDSLSLAVRDERDENIRKFRRLVINSQSKGYTELYIEEEGAEGSIRGRVQDRESVVKPQEMFTLSYYIQTEGQLRFTPKQAFSDALFTEKEGRQIFVVWQVPELNELQTREHLEEIRLQQGTPFSLGMASLSVKDYAAATESFSKAIEVNPDLAAAYFERGVTRFTAHLRSLSSRSGGEGDLILRKAVSQAAIADFEKALELVPDYAPALYNIGYVCYTVGRYTEAVSYFQKAIAVSPDMGVAYFNLGLSQYALGEKALGDESMSRAGALGIYDAYSIIKRMQ